MINNLYFGATRYVTGSSIFDLKPSLTIEEGYNYGASNEYIKLGDYLLEEVSQIGANRSQLQIKASSPMYQQKNVTNILSKTIKSPYYFYDPFDDINLFQNKYYISSSGMTFRNGYVRSIHPANQKAEYIILTDKSDFTNLTFSTTILRSSTTSSGRAFLQLFRYTNPDNTLRISYDGGRVDLDIVTGGTVINVASKIGVSVSANQDYYLRTSVYDSRVIHSGSTDGINFTTHIDSDNVYDSISFDSSGLGVVPISITKGGVGLQLVGSSGGYFDVKEFTVSEIEDLKTFKDIQKELYAGLNIFDVTSSSELSDFSSFINDSGSSWVLGSSNNVTIVSSLSGSSWSTFMTTGSTFEDFVFECQMIGVSGVQPGILVGSTSNFYIYSQNLGVTSQNNTEHYFNGRLARQGWGSYINSVSNNEYNLKLVKSDLDLFWFINGCQVTSIRGSSLIPVSGKGVRIGFGVLKNGISVTFYNPQVSYLDNLSETVRVESGDNIPSLLGRFVTSSTEPIYSNNSIELVEVGASRGVINIGNKFKNISILDPFSTVTDFVNINGEKDSIYLGSSLYKSRKSLSLTGVDYLQDSNIRSSYSARKVASKFIKQLDRKSQSISFDLDGGIVIQNGDFVSVSDPISGISGLYIVRQVSKNFFADNSKLTTNVICDTFING